MSMRKIMVCVTVDKTCQRLIQMGAMLKEREEDEMFVVAGSAQGWRSDERVKR